MVNHVTDVSFYVVR